MSANDWVSPLFSWLKDGIRDNPSRGKYYNPDTGKVEQRGDTSTPAKPKSSGNVVRIGGKEYSEEDYFGTANKSYRDKAVHEQRSLGRGGKGHDLRGGGGRKSDGSRMAMPGPAGPAESRDGGGTKTSPTGKGTAASPMDWAQYEAWLGNRGIQVRGGYQSNALPGTKSSQFNGENVDLESDTFTKGQSDFKEFVKGELPTTDADGYPIGRQEDGGYFGGGGTYKPTGEEQAGGAQEGMSSAPDVGDQSRALRIPKGGRQAEFFERQNPRGTETMSAPEPMTSSISARSRAFLDAPMGVGPMGVMRRTNAAQGILRNNGKIAIKTGDGEYTEITQEGYDEIRQNRRNATEFKEDFMRNYVPESPAETQSPDSGSPVSSSKMEYNTNFGPTVDTESYGQLLDSTKGMKGMGPIADGDAYGMFLDGREPLMRGPKEDEE